MNPLERYFRDLSDEALLRKLASDDLTAEARRAAETELRARNIDPTAARTPIEPAPKHAPPAPRTQASTNTGPNVLRGLAWLYFVAVLALLAMGFGRYVADLHRLSAAVLALSTGTMLLDVVACIGFYGWLRAQRIGARGLWAACVMLKIAQFGVGIAYWALVVHQLNGPNLLGAALDLPLIAALWHYAFVSLALWDTTAARPVGEGAAR